MNQLPLIFIVGPTACGKSEISFPLAIDGHAEIISCDALQVYREINIASDKPSASILAQVPHHLINMVSVTEEFNVAQYRKLALKAMDEIASRGKQVIIVGGSGMYMSILLDGIFEEMPVNEELKEQLDQELAQLGSAVLHERLKDLDPVAAARIHPNDPQRILRALSVVQSSGVPLSNLQPKRDGLWGKRPVVIIGLNRSREELYERVEARIDSMFTKGLVNEIKAISDLPLSQTAQKLIGIPEVLGYLRHEYDLERAKYLMKLNTRHYVKRQLTWFRRDKRLQWIELSQEKSTSQTLEMIKGMIRQ